MKEWSHLKKRSLTLGTQVFSQTGLVENTSGGFLVEMSSFRSWVLGVFIFHLESFLRLDINFQCLLFTSHLVRRRNRQWSIGACFHQRAALVSVFDCIRNEPASRWSIRLSIRGPKFRSLTAKKDRFEGKAERQNNSPNYIHSNEEWINFKAEKVNIDQLQR